MGGGAVGVGGEALIEESDARVCASRVSDLFGRPWARIRSVSNVTPQQRDLAPHRLEMYRVAAPLGFMGQVSYHRQEPVMES